MVAASEKKSPEDLILIAELTRYIKGNTILEVLLIIILFKNGNNGWFCWPYKKSKLT
jgi:hypothetical protein